jgi:predicted dehydrogenase
VPSPEAAKSVAEGHLHLERAMQDEKDFRARHYTLRFLHASVEAHKAGDHLREMAKELNGLPLDDPDERTILLDDLEKVRQKLDLCVQMVAGMHHVVERARDVAQMCDAQSYADYRDMLDGVDAAWICTPPFLHREQAETCAAAGKHLFVEKPLALGIGDCEAITNAARNAGVKLMVGHVFHFYPVFQEAYRRFEAGELSDLVTCWCKRLAYPTANLMVPWRADPRQGGGFTIEVQIHELDFVTWFGGEPVSIRGAVTRDGPDHSGIDVEMWALITHRSGSVGEVTGSWRARGAFSQRAIVGTRATLVHGEGLLRAQCRPRGVRAANWRAPEHVHNSCGLPRALAGLRGR